MCVQLFKWIHITILKVIYNAPLVVAEAQTRIVYDGIVCMIATTRVQWRAKVARLVCLTILSFLLGLVTRSLLLLTLPIPRSPPLPCISPFFSLGFSFPLFPEHSVVNLLVFVVLLPASGHYYFTSANCTNKT